MSSKYKQGTYRPRNPDKFIGSTATYRSGLELKFFRFCDYNPNIVKWSSESVVVPYISPIDGKVHRYFVDNYVVIKEGNILKKYLVEIKPYKQTMPPPKPKRQTKGYIYEAYEYAKNQSKWEAAREYCKDRGWTFKILTENELYGK